jgi:glycerol dehydrogenase-like iron-containing ADH family enzyme
MLIASPIGLGDFVSDLTKLVSSIPGGKAITSAATSAANDVVARIRTEAEAGAKNAIPMIKAEVEKTVKPWVLAAIVAGGLGFAMGGTALALQLRRR